MTQPVRIAIVGDYNQDSSHHVATNEALTHTAEFLSIPLEYTRNYIEEVPWTVGSTR
jgi:CTP synthase (UTP-ammonia lyase)